MKGRSRRWLANPLAQFLAVGVLALIAIVSATSELGGRAAQDEVLRDARGITEVLASSVAEPSLPRGLVDGEPGALDRFDRAVTGRMLIGDVRRIKVWRADGTIVYSDDVRLIGEQFPLGKDELAILRTGGSDAEVSDLSEPENRYERGGGGLVEVYTRILAPENEPLLFEAYFTVDRIEERQAEVIAPFLKITLGALAVVVGMATSLLWLLTRRASRLGAERERLLRAAVDASAAERRRIARDLHDGVVQDLAGSAFTLSACAREASEPTRSLLISTSDSMRGSLRALRSLLVEIHPPGLTAATLPSALEDLTAPAGAAGVEVDLQVGDLTATSDQTVTLAWRVAQEVVRNTLRHARARTLRIEVVTRAPGGGLIMTVSDDGVGFDHESSGGAVHYGLRGLASLVADAGGTLDVTSTPGSGTTTVFEVRT